MNNLIAACCFLLTGSIAHGACWETRAGQGALGFTATSAGASTRGEFRTFRGTLCLPGGNPPASAVVEIETGSIDMGLPEFDTEMRGPLFFDVARWPIARFMATHIEVLESNQYRVRGDLTIRDVTREVEADFLAEPAPDGLRVSASFRINRLDFDLGLGEWQDTAWVSNEVVIRLESTLVEAPP